MSTFGSSRSRLAAVAAVAGVVVLAACGSDSEDGSASSDDGQTAVADPDADGAADSDQAGQDSAVRAEPDVAGTTTLQVDADYEDIPEEAGDQLLAPGLELRITGIAQLAELDAAVYEDVTGRPVPEADDADEPTPQAVAPAEGQIFVAAAYASDDPQWRPRQDGIPDSTASILLGGNVAADVFSTADGTRQQGTIIASVAADPEPSAAAIEVETDERFQSLSLIDGTRLSSDIEHIYRLPGADVEIGDVPEFLESFEGWTGETRRIGGQLADGFVTPWLSRDSGGNGWAGAEKVYLSIDMEWTESSGTATDETQLQVLLEDGTTVEHSNDPSSLVHRFSDNAVFQIPVDTTEVTVVVTPQVTVGTSDSPQTWDSFSTTLTLEAADGEAA